MLTSLVNTYLFVLKSTTFLPPSWMETPEAAASSRKEKRREQQAPKQLPRLGNAEEVQPARAYPLAAGTLFSRLLNAQTAQTIIFRVSKSGHRPLAHDIREV